MLTEKRHEDLLKLLQEQEVIQVADAAQQFNVSMQTIRRDFKELESQGLIRKVRGGAMLAQPRSQEPLYTTRAISMLVEKQAIAEATADLIHDGESIFLDLGTTTMEVAKRLYNHHSLTIITNSLKIAQIVADLPNITIYLTGGQLRPSEHSLSGNWAQQSLQNIYVDKAIVGAGGLRVDTGLTDFHMEEAAIRRMMIQQSNQTIVATDSTKLGVTALVGVVSIQHIHTLVTDSGIEPDWLEAFQSAGLEVITTLLKNESAPPKPIA